MSTDEKYIDPYLFGKNLYGGFFGSNRLHLSDSPDTRHIFLIDLNNIVVEILKFFLR